MKTRDKFLCLIVAGVLLSCAFFACGGSVGETATIKISIGNDLTGKATVGFDQLKHTITLTGPTGTKTADIGPGGGTISIAVVPGLWQIGVEAYYGEELYAVGAESADVKAGRSTSVLVQMTVVWSDSAGVPTTTPFDPGDGTQANPFKVYNVATLQRVGKGTDPAWVGDWALDAYYEMTADINLTGVAFEPIGGDGTTGNPPPFDGNFDGKCKTISNLVINNPSASRQALFGYISGGTVSTLTLTGLSVTGNLYVGGVVGFNMSGTVEDCKVAGTVTGNGDTVGGVVGFNGGTVQGCNFTGNVTSTDFYAGGVVGYNTGLVQDCHTSGTVTVIDAGNGKYSGGVVGLNTDTVENCSSASNVSGNDQVGGVVGENNGTVENCYSIGDVNGSSSANGTGGIVGKNMSMVEKCYSTGNVNGSDEVGGVVGWNEGTVQNCYSTSDVSATNYEAGGVVAYNVGTVENCYATGNISGDQFIGGVVANNYGSGEIKNCYYTSSISGYDIGGGVVGQNNGVTVSNCVALNPAITRTVNGANDNFGRVVGDNAGGLTGNYARNPMPFYDVAPPTTFPSAAPITSNLAGYHGAGITSAEWGDATWWTNYALFTDPWWNGKLPPVVP